MKNYHSALFLLMTSSAAFAGSFNSLRIDNLLSRPTATDVSECVDLSGTWVGQCTEGDETTEETMTINQYECSSIIVDSDSVQIGKTSTKVETVDDQQTTTTITPNWNEDKTALLTDISVESKSIGQQQVNFTLSVDGKVNMEIIDEELHTYTDFKGKVVSTDPAYNSDFQSESTCVYKRM